MEFYLGFRDLMAHTAMPVMIALSPVVVLATLAEGVMIVHRDGAYPWRNASVSVCMTIGHFVTQAAAHGVIFGVIAASVYAVRLTTIPVSFDHWISLIVLFVLVDLAFYVEHRCS
ncbi:MAG: hypothetical protein JSS43_14985, partial [Proteobacteria bacterium]|nr:hypothetical protein [Pseudomonadota bacterium]